MTTKMKIKLGDDEEEAKWDSSISSCGAISVAPDDDRSNLVLQRDDQEYYCYMMSNGLNTSEIEEAEDEEEQHHKHFQTISRPNSSSILLLDTISEEEIIEIDEQTTIGSVFSFDFHKAIGKQDDGGGAAAGEVYVTVGHGNGKSNSEESSSMDALLWTLANLVSHNENPVKNQSSSSTTSVFLIHVFPEIKFIPMPLGMIPVSQVNPEQKEKYMVQERNKRRDFLQKFINICSASKVTVDTILIESDMEAKAILDLIPILNIRTLVLGITKANLRRTRGSSKRGSNAGLLLADQIKKGAPEFCDVKIICEGKETPADAFTDSFPLQSPSSNSSKYSQRPSSFNDQDQRVSLSSNDSFTCGCFVKPKVNS